MFQMDKAAQDNRANQKNPNHPEYKGGPQAQDNRADQKNPNNPKHLPKPA